MQFEEPFIPIDCRPAVTRELADEAWEAARRLIDMYPTDKNPIPTKHLGVDHHD